jgi:hypothetical protein
MPVLRPRHVSHRTAALAGLLLLAGTASAEVVWLRDGDRLTGKIVAETKRSVRLRTPYGQLLIPKSRIERLVRADGKEEVFGAPSPGPSPSPVVPAVPAARLVLVITGASFWHAWDRREAPADPTLRLELRLDEEPIASWTDQHLDPEDLRGAVVNTFAFDAGDASGQAAADVRLGAPEVQPGRVRLRLEAPGWTGRDRRLGVAYQTNDGTAEKPSWRDAAFAAEAVTLPADGPAVIQVRQDRGRMEYTGFPRKRMRHVETFLIDLAPEYASPSPSPSPSPFGRGSKPVREGIQAGPGGDPGSVLTLLRPRPSLDRWTRWPGRR